MPSYKATIGKIPVPYLAEDSVTYNTVSLSWTLSRSYPKIVNWELQRDGVLLTSPAKNDSSYLDTTVSESTNYTYRIRFIDRSNRYSEWSNEIVASVPAFQDVEIPVITSFTVTGVTDNSISLAWTGSDNVAITSFELQRSSDQSTWLPITLPNNGLDGAYTDTGRSAGTTYYYRLKAFDAAGNQSAFNTVTGQTTGGTGLSWPTQGAVSYTPIYPGLRGPGTETAGGSGRSYNTTHSQGTTVTKCRLYKVNSLSDASSITALGDNVYTGTLRGCINHHNANATGQTFGTVVFEVSGTITIGSNLLVSGSNFSIHGQTAPAPGIQIVGDAIFGSTAGSDQFFQHLTVRKIGTSSVEGARFNNGGRKVLDHMTVLHGMDENFEMGYSTIGTVANSILAEPAAETDGTGADHRFNVMFTNAGPDSRILLYGTILANAKERNPMGRGPKQAMVNCLTYHWTQNAWQLQIDSTLGGAAQIYTAVGNVWIQKSGVSANKPIWTHSSSTPPAGTTLYVRANLSTETISGGQWNAVTTRGSVPTQENAASDASATFWPTGMVALDPTGTNLRDNEVFNVIINYAGSRPANRDTTAQRLINEIINDTGSLKTRAFAAADVPTYAQNFRAFTVPADRDVINANGYTLLEEHIQSFDAEVLL